MEKLLISTDINIQFVFIENKINPKYNYSRTTSQTLCVQCGEKSRQQEGPEAKRH